MPEEVCAICGKSRAVSCKFCGNNFCLDHQQPDRHSCAGLEKWREEEGKEEASAGSNYGTFMRRMVKKKAEKRRLGEKNKNAWPT
jgi:hypothetical protein